MILLKVVVAIGPSILLGAEHLVLML